MKKYKENDIRWYLIKIDKENGEINFLKNEIVITWIEVGLSCEVKSYANTCKIVYFLFLYFTLEKYFILKK